MLVPLPALDVPFQSIDWTPIFPQQKNQSEYTRRSRIVGMPGAEGWTGEAVSTPVASETEARAWRAFVIACRGCENTFRLPALEIQQRAGAQSIVTGAVAGNRAVAVSSVAGVELGMYATVHQADGRDRMVAIVGIDGLTVHFEPYLIAAPATGQPFEINAPWCEVRFADPQQRMPKIGQAVRLAVEEAL